MGPGLIGHEGGPFDSGLLQLSYERREVASVSPAGGSQLLPGPSKFKVSILRRDGGVTWEAGITGPQLMQHGLALETRLRFLGWGDLRSEDVYVCEQFVQVAQAAFGNKRAQTMQLHVAGHPNLAGDSKSHVSRQAR